MSPRPKWKTLCALFHAAVSRSAFVRFGVGALLGAFALSVTAGFMPRSASEVVAEFASLHDGAGAGGEKTQRSPSDLVVLALHLDKSGRRNTSVWNEIFKREMSSSADFSEFILIARNDLGLPLSEFYQALASAGARVDISVDAEFTSRYWPLFILGHMDAPDAMDARHAEFTRRLISAVISRESGAVIGPLLDIHGPMIIADREWSSRIVRSESLVTAMMSRLSLLRHMPSEARSTLRQAIQRREPQLLSFYERLALTKSPEELLARVPSGPHLKAKWVHLGVRSALDHFLSLTPTSDDVRKLGQWMHDYDELFHIKEKAIARARDAAEFLRITDDDYPAPQPEAYLRRLNEFLLDQLDEFLRLKPTIAQIHVFRSRLRARDLDFAVIREIAGQLRTAGEFIALIGPLAKESVVARHYLLTNVDTFARLEPTIDEVNAFRRLVPEAETDLRLMELMAPKITTASDFLRMMSMYKVSRDNDPLSYSSRLHAFAASHAEMFLVLRPTASQIARYREWVFVPQVEMRLVDVGLQLVRSPAEALALVTRRPYSRTVESVESWSRMLENHFAHFVSRHPSVVEMDLYLRSVGDAATIQRLQERRSLIFPQSSIK